MDFHPSIVRLEESLIERAGDAMARAFFNDPLCVYMLPDEEERARLTPWHFSAFLRYAHLFGEVYTTSGTPDATAAWLPPGESEMTAERIEQSGLNKVPQVLGAEAWGRFARVSDYIEGLHPREASEPHWYLPLNRSRHTTTGAGHGWCLAQPNSRSRGQRRFASVSLDGTTEKCGILQTAWVQGRYRSCRAK
jgi:hypothetical protein